jgi:hypothetical protein
VERLGNLIQVLDSPETVRASARQSRYPKRYVPRGFTPPLHTACAREMPNLEMLEVLAHKCGANVNARAVVGMRRSQDLLDGPTALQVLAKAQFWW